MFPDVNITRPYELITYSNSVTEGWLGAVIVLGAFIIAFMALKNYRTSSAFATASFIVC